MGVKTTTTLDEINKLFKSYNFTKLVPTKDGVMDTTYIIFNSKNSYILKKYERDIKDKIDEDIKLLGQLKSRGLNVPTCLEHKNGWYLYEKLKGDVPKLIKLYNVQALARFIAKLHCATYKTKTSSNFIQNYELTSILSYTKSNFFFYYKKLESLKNYTQKNDGIIHGDIFKDNTVFYKQKIGVFDFIDSGCGEFTFDIAVSLVSFNPSSSKLYINIFLNTYNQYAPKKISKTELLKNINIAKKFYALLRIDKYKKITKAKELICNI
jgi:homoserine kinase type II